MLRPAWSLRRISCVAALLTLLTGATVASRSWLRAEPGVRDVRLLVPEMT